MEDDGHARRLIEDTSVVADLYHRCAESYGVKRAQCMMGLKFRDERIPTAFFGPCDVGHARRYKGKVRLARE